MNNSPFEHLTKWSRLGLPLMVGLIILIGLIANMSQSASPVLADPIDPPEGYPKLSLSLKTVTPTLASTNGTILSYSIEIRNTGAYTAVGATLVDPIPAGTTYSGGATASAPTLNDTGGQIAWQGDVGFDDTVTIDFSISVPAGFTGTVQNTAVISHHFIAKSISITAETVVTDDPIFVIEKTSAPQFPGENKPMAYSIVVENRGQPAVNLPITVTDKIPVGTTFRDADPDGQFSAGMVTWERTISLDLGETTEFTFSVDVGTAPSGTVISNANYWVEGPGSKVTAGEVYTVTIIEPILSLSKRTEPDPPGSNREATYILTLFNEGSLVTDLVVSDTVPAGVTYLRGGYESGGVVSWTLPSLDSFESADFTYTVYISDVADVEVVNSNFGVCSSEGVCEAGQVLISVVQGPIFVTTAHIEPIAKKPGGGKVYITPTLTVQNVGNGNALGATVVVTFYRFSMTNVDVSGYFDDGSEQPLPIGPNCPIDGLLDGKCRTFSWMGDIAVDETITFSLASTVDIMSTIGGSEGDELLAGIIVTDTTSNGSVFTSTALGRSKITHLANVSVEKYVPAFIGAGQVMTYTIWARNNGFTTDQSPIVTDVVPLSTTVVSISDGGQEISGGGIMSPTIVSWTLDLMGPGDEFVRRFAVQIDPGLVSGTQIVNRYYKAFGYGNVVSGTVGGAPVTTTVREIGLIDSYKVVTPALVSPGPGNVLTFAVHVVNSSPIPLSGVTVYDWLPWESSTYQRDAVASAGSVISDIVSIEWTGSVGAYSEEVFTITVLVDADFQGAITNTAVISHADLSKEVTVKAVAYVTDDPELRISKSASPDPVRAGNELMYTIRVWNLGQQATGLVITDVIPVGTTFVAKSASAGGVETAGQVEWVLSSLDPGESREFQFYVTTSKGYKLVTNDAYGVRADGGFVVLGIPVSTKLVGGYDYVYLPVVVRQ